MSANISINLHANDPRAIVLTCENGQRFITFYVDDDVSLYVHGFDAQAVVSARSIAACMTQVADDLERRIATDPPVVIDVVAPEPVEDEVMF